MADYDNWNQPCCGGFPGHEKHCPNHPNYTSWKARQDNIAEKKVQGYVYLGTQGRDILWGCRRGCGVVVWDTDTHSQNVCREFNPIAG